MRGSTNLDVAVIVFARAPLAGRVKTRLAAAIGAERALRLHLRLTARALATAKAARCGPVMLYATRGHSLFPRARLQRGADLGERMQRAIAAALRRHRAAIVIGVDCPALRIAHLTRAARWLAGGADVVIGPAEDGGYVLIGARRVLPQLFAGIAWGSSAVFAQTAERLRGRRWRALAPLWDVDRQDDIRRLQSLPLTILALPRRVSPACYTLPPHGVGGEG